MPRFTDPRSLRWKVALGVAIAACGMALGIGALVHQTTKDRSFSIGRSSAVQQLDAAKIAFRDERPPARAEAGGPYYAIGDAVPDQLVNLVNAAAGPVTWYDTRRPAQGPQMWAAERVNNTVVAVNVNMVVDKLSRQALDRHMMYAALATLAVVVPLTVLAAELMLRRLRRVAVTARQIKRGDLNVRTRTRGNDEISEISAAVNQMADALQERLHAEQRFTADVAHELRTPLTGLVTSASLLPESQATDLVRDRVQVLRALVDDLLEISRLDAGAEQADAREVPIGELLAESVRRTGLDTQLTVTGHPVVETDPRRLDRIVTNLVLNAHRHGGTPVEITVKDATIVVRDHGPGFPPEILAHGPQRFRTGAAERGHGHGLGLTIALGQTHVLGAHLTLTNTTPHGAVATLELPRHKE
ncbi:HAMP domain-containing histidine kinase [Streptomyces sp. NBC_01167]|uniref:sensor histidine kinase n=1 Tax=Streptomyces sp. NBC_01167 TaxID=2903756 RepID=UPI00386C002A|nr:HAMP domain-containing histidine kinase [Streptomyces sp. NBC_01167]